MVRQEDSTELRGEEAGQEEDREGSTGISGSCPARLPRSSRPPASTGTFFFGFLGLVLVAGGITLALSPHFSETLSLFDQKLVGLGFEHGSMVFGGIVLFAVGIVARQMSRLHREHSEDSARSDLLLVIDQLATDSNQLLTSVLRVSEEVAALSEGQANLSQQQHTLAEKQMDGAKDGLFRLAASIDKLHARIDERFHEVDVQVRSRFESMLHTLHETRSALEGRLVHPEGPRPALPKEETPRIEFFETLERLESKRHSEGSAERHEAPFPSTDSDPLSGLLSSEVRRIISRREPS